MTITHLTALIAAMTLAATLPAGAADATTALTGKRLHVIRADGSDLGTVTLDGAGAAHRAAPGGEHSDGTWVVKGDRICVTLPPRGAACYHSVRDLVANGHATMTNAAGNAVKVSIE